MGCSFVAAGANLIGSIWNNLLFVEVGPALKAVVGCEPGEELHPGWSVTAPDEARHQAHGVVLCTGNNGS